VLRARWIFRTDLETTNEWLGCCLRRIGEYIRKWDPTCRRSFVYEDLGRLLMPGAPLKSHELPGFWMTRPKGVLRTTSMARLSPVT
jgi:hypothetical protein